MSRFHWFSIQVLQHPDSHKFTSDTYLESYDQQKMVSVPDLESRTYIRWDAKDIECVPPNEAEDIQKVADMFNDVQRAFFNKTRHCYSGTHARTQGIVKGKFIVPDDLPPHLKQTEIFSTGGEYDAACRYSSEPSDPGLDDRIPQPRGFTIKLFGVNGPRFLTDLVAKIAL